MQINGRYIILDTIYDHPDKPTKVYRGKDETLNREVALKCYKNHSSNLKKDMRAGILEHRSVIKIYDIFEIEGETDPDINGFYVVMPYLKGGNLRRNRDRLLQSGPLLLNTISDLVDGLAYLHQNYIVHRDLKPENLLFDHQNHLYIVDFDVSSNISQGTKSLAGTYQYIAPEMFSGDIDFTNDIYALGVILFELVTGMLPFKPSNSAKWPDWVNTHKNRDETVEDQKESFIEACQSHPQLYEIGPELWTGIVSQCLRKDPEARCTSQQLLDVLKTLKPGYEPVKNLPFAQSEKQLSDICSYLITIFNAEKQPEFVLDLPGVIQIILGELPTESIAERLRARLTKYRESAKHKYGPVQTIYMDLLMILRDAISENMHGYTTNRSPTLLLDSATKTLSQLSNIAAAVKGNRQRVILTSPEAFTGIQRLQLNNTQMFVGGISEFKLDPTDLNPTSSTYLFTPWKDSKGPKFSIEFLPPEQSIYPTIHTDLVAKNYGNAQKITHKQQPSSQYDLTLMDHQGWEVGEIHTCEKSLNELNISLSSVQVVIDLSPIHLDGFKMLATNINDEEALSQTIEILSSRA